mgnify:CR=1 FL=1
MTDKIKIALAQINPKLGDVAGNVARISKARAEAAAGGADLVLAPELVVSGIGRASCRERVLTDV